MTSTRLPLYVSSPALHQTNAGVLNSWIDDVSGHVGCPVATSVHRRAVIKIILCACKVPCSSEIWIPVAETIQLARLHKSPCPRQLPQMPPFCSVAMNFSQRRATTPVDFCVCHLWPARITLQIYTAPDPEKCFQLPPAGVNLLSWPNWNGTPWTLDKATKLRHRATAPVAAPPAINNIKVWMAQKPRSAVRVSVSQCGGSAEAFVRSFDAARHMNYWVLVALVCILYTWTPTRSRLPFESHESASWRRGDDSPRMTPVGDSESVIC